MDNIGMLHVSNILYLNCENPHIVFSRVESFIHPERVTKV